jgi:hypothetical protein
MNIHKLLINQADAFQILFPVEITWKNYMNNAQNNHNNAYNFKMNVHVSLK